MATKPTAAKTPKLAAAKPGARAAGKLAASTRVARKAAKPEAQAAVYAPKVNLPLRLKGLLDGATETSGVKKKDVKTVGEAVLVQIGAALARGETVNLRGLGHLRVARKGTPESPSMTLKLRQGGGSKGKGKSAGAADKDGLAEDSDQG